MASVLARNATVAADVVIVGGGVMGMSSAFWIKKRSPSSKVILVERDCTYKKASTPLSAGSVRVQFSNRENIEICKFSSDFIKNADAHLSVEGTSAGLQFVEGGYLFLASETGLPVLRGNYETQTSCGADVELLDAGALQNKFSWLSTDGVQTGSFGRSGEGWFDPHSLLMAFRRKARSLGVEIVEGDVTAVPHDERSVHGVEVSNGVRITAGTVVNAAGAWAGRLAQMAGTALPVTTENGPSRAPLTIDPSGVYFRPEGKQFICGVAPAETEDPDTFDLNVQWPLWENVIWPVLAQRVPVFEAARVTNAWAGLYDYNTFDQNGIVGRHPVKRNLLCANGFSGHGLQQSPAVGRAISELVLDGRFVTLDLTRMGVERILENRPLFELNIV